MARDTGPCSRARMEARNCSTRPLPLAPPALSTPAGGTRRPSAPTGTLLRNATHLNSCSCFVLTRIGTRVKVGFPDREACDHMVDARQLAGPFSWRKVMAVVFSVGIRPCTGAILVLVFTVTQGLFWAGVAATITMALGTAITVALLATATLGSRELALKLGGTSSSWANAVWTTCAIGGAVVIFLFGALLFAASLGPQRPF